MSYRVVNGKLYSTKDFTEYSSVSLKTNKSKDNKVDNISKKDISPFNKVLDKQIKKDDGFTISAHAAQRLNSRNINIEGDDLNKINEGINMASDKGSKQSLILYKNMGLITSIKNRTVITAIDKNENKGKVITNIDSVVMI